MRVARGSWRAALRLLELGERQLAKIHIRKGHRAQKKRAIADALQASLVASLDVPEQDRFQLIQEYEDDHFIHTDAFLDLTYTRDLLMIEIAFIEGRSDELKKALLADLNRRLVETADMRSDDVFVSMYDAAGAAGRWMRFERAAPWRGSEHAPAGGPRPWPTCAPPPARRLRLLPTAPVPVDDQRERYEHPGPGCVPLL